MCKRSPGWLGCRSSTQLRAICFRAEPACTDAQSCLSLGVLCRNTEPGHHGSTPCVDWRIMMPAVQPSPGSGDRDCIVKTGQVIVFAQLACTTQLQTQLEWDDTLTGRCSQPKLQGRLSLQTQHADWQELMLSSKSLPTTGMHNHAWQAALAMNKYTTAPWCSTVLHPTSTTATTLTRVRPDWS